MTASKGRPQRITDDELLDDLHRLGEEYGHPATSTMIQERGEYGYQTYYRRFGSIAEIREAAGLE